MRHNQFDTIYHDHFSYLSLTALAPLFARHGLMAFDVERLSTHGGSLRLFVGRENGPRAIGVKFKALPTKSATPASTSSQPMRRLPNASRTPSDNCCRFLCTLKDSGATIAAYGAPAKGNTLLNYCGIGTDMSNSQSIAMS